MKRIVFLLLLVYASSILNVSELYAQKVNVGVITVIKEEEKIEKEKKVKKEKEKKEKEQKEIRDYTHSAGIAVGSSFGLAYKYFFKDNWALKVDITDNVYKGYGYWSIFSNFDFNLNVVYQMPIKTFKTCRLDFFAGGGTTFGYANAGNSSGYRYCVNRHMIHNGYGDTFVWGLNGILGLEINLAIPMTIEFDFRPGYGLFAGDIEWYCGKYGCYSSQYEYIVDTFFDWSVNATISYKF